jgi:hypothetical protein
MMNRVAFCLANFDKFIYKESRRSRGFMFTLSLVHKTLLEFRIARSILDCRNLPALFPEAYKLCPVNWNYYASPD